MINEPLFQDDILQNLIRNFRYYLFNTEWLNYALGLMLIFYGFYFIIRKCHCSAYSGLFPAENFKFDFHNRVQCLGIAFLVSALLVYSAVIISLDNSLFNNYDLMSLNTIYTFFRGLSPYYNPTRLAPISFFDVNWLYAVTHNYNLVNIYVILKQILITWLFYRFLSFIPVIKRCIIIGTLTLVPALFWLNNIIFPEQNMLIFMLLSFIFIKKFSESGKYINLWYFAVFSTLAVYTKETTIIFYTGILAVGILYNVFNEKINLSNIFRPFKLAKEMPIEAFIFLIGLSFAIFYFFVTDTTDGNIYITKRVAEYPTLFALYKYEIVITVLAWLVALKKLIKKESGNPVFNEGLLLGGTFILFYMIFHLKMTTVLSHVQYKSYYALLSAVFSTLYIFRNLYNKKIIIAVFSAIMVYSAVFNYKIYKNENGWYYREAAEFFGQELKKEGKLVIMFSSNTEKSEWVRESWSSAFAYYFPKKDITFKFPSLAIPSQSSTLTLFLYHRMLGYLTPIKGGAIPTIKEYYIIKKGEADNDYKYIKDIPHDLVFENKRFKIYKIK